MAIGKISNFKSALTLGGARASLFDVSVFAPISTVSGLEALGRSQYQCTTTSIPGLTVTPIERQYFGRTVKLPGELTFGTLSTTFINPEDYGIRKAMETCEASSCKIQHTSSSTCIWDHPESRGLRSKIKRGLIGKWKELQRYLTTQMRQVAGEVAARPEVRICEQFCA